MRFSHYVNSSNSRENCNMHCLESQAGKDYFHHSTGHKNQTPFNIPITEHLKLDLIYWRTLVHHISTNPNPVQLLVGNDPNYIQYTDACNIGAVGVITPGMTPVQYWVC